jgi:hypothetical protein
MSIEWWLKVTGTFPLKIDAPEKMNSFVGSGWLQHPLYQFSVVVRENVKLTKILCKISEQSQL